MFRITLLVLSYLALNAKAFEVTDECCSGIITPTHATTKPAARYVTLAPARAPARRVTYVQRPRKIVHAEPVVEYVTESAPSRAAEYVESAPAEEYEEIETFADTPKAAAPAEDHYEAPASAATSSYLAPKITIEITATPQPVTEASAPAHSEAVRAPAASSCGQANGCGSPSQKLAYVEQKEYVPVRRSRPYYSKRIRYARPYQAPARYVTYETQPQRLEAAAAPCATVCHASAGCCQ